MKNCYHGTIYLTNGILFRINTVIKQQQYTIITPTVLQRIEVVGMPTTFGNSLIKCICIKYTPKP